MSNPELTQQESDRLVAAQDSESSPGCESASARFVFPMTVVFLSWYLLYVDRVRLGPRLHGPPRCGATSTSAYVFGLLQFVSTFLIAWLYERHMEDKVDPLAADDP